MSTHEDDIPLVAKGKSHVEGEDVGSDTSTLSGAFYFWEHGWRRGLCFGALAAIVVLVINIGLLMWIKTSRHVEDGFATLFTGYCETTRQILIWVELAINAMSSVLLAASNNCFQVLSAPDRAQIDKAHSNRRWVDIGAPSLKNLRTARRWRLCACFLVFASSIPLHLLYNSVFFAVESSNKYMAVIATEDFPNNTAVQGDIWNASNWNYNDSPALLQDDWNDLKLLSNEECIKAYGSPFAGSGWASVVVVTSPDPSVSANSSLLAWYFHNPAYKSDDDTDEWMCSDDTGTSCDTQKLLSKPADWAIPAASNDGLILSSDYGPWLVPCFGASSCPIVRVPVQFCKARWFGEACQVKASTTILTVVVACNVIKLLCIAGAVLSRNFRPIATLGDAIETFLRRPEPSTVDDGPRAMRYYQNKHREDNARPVQHRASRLKDAPGILRWSIGLLLCAALWIAALLLITVSTSTNLGGRATLWDGGIGGLNPNNLVQPTEGWPIIANILLANAPQVLVSFVYIFYNNILTCMLSAREWGRFSQRYHVLRVSKPVAGRQRSTYWLQVPYRYSVPLLVAMVLLHWSISRSIFLVQLNVYAENDVLLPIGQGGSMDICGFSAPAVVFALAIGACLIIALLGLSAMKVPGNAPLVGRCSLAISAACHPDPSEGDIALRPLKYGRFTIVTHDEQQHERVGFSSRPVGPVISRG